MIKGPLFCATETTKCSQTPVSTKQSSVSMLRVIHLKGGGHAKIIFC